MARNRKKKSLYEVIGRSRLKSGHEKTLGRFFPERSEKNQAIEAGTTTAVPEGVPGWPKRPRIVQFNAGRIEFSMPYQLAIALLLGLILLVLVAFRLGQINQKASDSAEETQKMAVEATVTAVRTADIAEKAPVNAKKVGQVEPKGNNLIVIQTYQLRTHLEPVKQYFAEKGIETEIMKIGDMYYLVTKDKYENPERPGTDGYQAKQKIIEFGAKYKSPQGFESFGRKPFHDAYGMKLDN